MVKKRMINSQFTSIDNPCVYTSELQKGSFYIIFLYFPKRHVISKTGDRRAIS